MTDYEVNPYIWFADRQLDFTPPHFVTVTTPVTEESKQWVLDNLTGRFSISLNNDDFFTMQSLGLISFESHMDAMLFELKWS